MGIVPVQVARTNRSLADGIGSSMRNFELNTGGLVGALIGLVLFVAAYAMASATPETQNQSPKPLMMLIVFGAVVGNKLAAKREAASRQRSDSEDDGENVHDVDCRDAA